MKLHHYPATAVILLAISGCKSVPRDAGFADVRRNIDERLGKQVHWNQGSTEDQSVADSVHTMLQRELTVDDAVQITLLNNRSLQATYQTLGIAQADLVQAGLLRNPRFSGSISPAVGVSGTKAGLDLVTDFLNVFAIPLRKRAAAAEFEAAKARATASVLDVAGQTRLAFYDFQAAQQALDMWKTTVQATEASFTAAEKMREAGNISKLDLALDRALRNQAKLGMAKAEAAVSDSRERLTGLMGLWGMPASAWKTGSVLPPIPDQEIDLADFEMKVVAQSLELAASREHAEAVAKRRGVAKLQSVLPELEAGATSEREEDGTWFVGPALNLEIPIFDQGQARRFKARAEVSRALESHAALAVQIRSRARASANRLLQARSRAIFLRDEILPLRKEILDQTQLQLNAMQIGVFQLLQVKRDQIEAGRQYIETLRDYWRSRAAVELTLAGVSPSNGGSTALEDTGESDRKTSGGKERD